MQEIRIRKISPASKYWYVPEFGIRGSLGDIRRWAAVWHPGARIVKEGA